MSRTKPLRSANSVPTAVSPISSICTPETEPLRIWLDVEAGIFCTVSFEDYEWALSYKWQITWDRHKRKPYATRSTWDGQRRIKLYMHKEVLKRSMKLPPTRRHTMGDHGNGNSLTNERWNLSWATPSQNRRTARPPPAPSYPIPF